MHSWLSNIFLATPNISGPLFTFGQQPVEPREHPGTVFDNAFLEQGVRQAHAAKIEFEDGRTIMNPFQIRCARQEFLTGTADLRAVDTFLRKQGSTLRPYEFGWRRALMSLVISDFTGNSLFQDPDNPIKPVNPWASNYREATVFTYVEAPKKSPSRMPHMCPIKLYVEDHHIAHLAQAGGMYIGGFPKVPGRVMFWQTQSPLEQKPFDYDPRLWSSRVKNPTGLKATVTDDDHKVMWSAYLRTKRRASLPVPCVPISIAVATPPGILGVTFGLLEGARIYHFNARKDELFFPWGDKHGLDFKPLGFMIAERALLVVAAGDEVVNTHQAYTRLYPDATAGETP